MPAKSRRSRKKRGKPSTPVIVGQQPAVARTSESAPPSEVPRKPAPAKITAVQHPYIFAEIRRIGILAGIILAILIVLALVW